MKVSTKILIGIICAPFVIATIVILWFQVTKWYLSLVGEAQNPVTGAIAWLWPAAFLWIFFWFTGDHSLMSKSGKNYAWVIGVMSIITVLTPAIFNGYAHIRMAMSPEVTFPSLYFWSGVAQILEIGFIAGTLRFSGLKCYIFRQPEKAQHKPAI